MAQQSATHAPKPLARIMVAVDSTAASAAALRYLRRLLHPGATVNVVSVAENPRALLPLQGWSAKQIEAAGDELRHDATEAIRTARSALHGCGAQIDAQLLDLGKEGGDLVLALAEAASQWSPDLVVLGTRHRRALLRWVEGEVSAPLARLVHWPILVVPAEYQDGHDDPPSRILFATDGSGVSLSALRAGVRLASPRTEWRAVFVIDRLLSPATGPVEQRFEDALMESGRAAVAAAASELAALGPRKGWAVETAIVETMDADDDISHAIDREALHWGAQLVVLGTHGRRGLTRWLLGSVAERTLRLTSAPLLLVPAAAS